MLTSRYPLAWTSCIQSKAAFVNRNQIDIHRVSLKGYSLLKTHGAVEPAGLWNLPHMTTGGQHHRQHHHMATCI